MNEKVIFRVVIPWNDKSSMAQQARCFSGHNVNVISKYTGNALSLNKNLVPETPLLKSLNNSQYFLGKKDWLQDMSVSQRQYVNPHSDIGKPFCGGDITISAGVSAKGNGGQVQLQGGYGGAHGYSGLGFAANPLFQCSGMQGWTGLAPRYTSTKSLPAPRAEMTETTKKELSPKKAALHQQRMQKLKYRHLKHANQCVVDKYRLETQKLREQHQVELEKHKADSREKIAIQTAKYAMIETFVRCVAVVSTLASAMYFLT